jgi:oxaloacetate decarboxylase gamma subunit
MNDSLMSQGVDLMLYGMGMVVIFLALLVVSTMAMSWFIQRFFPEGPAPKSSPVNPEPVSVYPDTKVLAIIKAALDQHRRQDK